MVPILDGESGKPQVAAKKAEPKRANKTLGMADAMIRAMDPVMAQRGFARRDIIAHWADIVPAPYGSETLPERLDWPRGADKGEGATLLVRCSDAHALMLAHESERLAAAINRYFGYVLVNRVRRSATPFSPHSDVADQSAPTIAPEAERRIADTVSGVEAEGLRDALAELGRGIARKGRRSP